MTLLTQLQQAEQQLLEAQLASDVDTLAYLLADGVDFRGAGWPSVYQRNGLGLASFWTNAANRFSCSGATS